MVKVVKCLKNTSGIWCLREESKKIADITSAKYIHYGMIIDCISICIWSVLFFVACQICFVGLFMFNGSLQSL